MNDMMPAKVMLVTGASRGIGAQVALQAAHSGYAVAVNYLRSEAPATRLVDMIKATGRQAIAIRADVSDAVQVRHLFERVDESLGPIDVLVNNAGQLVSEPINDICTNGLEALFRANVFSAFFCIREAVQRMSVMNGGKGGVIVNMSSAAARHGGLPGGSEYSATKGAIDSLTIALAKELGPQRIRINALRPGVIDTEIHQAQGDPQAVQRMGATVPLGRAGTVEEVANSVLWLAGDASSYVHGAIVDVSGGR